MNSSHSLSLFSSKFIPQLLIKSKPKSLLHILYKFNKSTQYNLYQLIQGYLRYRLQLHSYGYCYAPIFRHRLIELLILQWPLGSASKPHSHGAAINFTKVLSGQVLERKYHISGGQLRIASERIVEAGQWAWTLPFEIHELLTLDTSAETMHIYLPGRKG
jgi:hypothetical protein